MAFYSQLTSFFLLFLNIAYVFAAQQILETNFPSSTAIPNSDERLIQLRMLGALPNKAQMVCTGFILTDPTTPIYVKQIKGYAPSTIVHHMALYGCDTRPPTPCGCPLRSRTTIFVSSLNTPPIRFPTQTYGNGDVYDSAMQIGESSSIQYVNIEVHYNGALTNPDSSTGVDLRIQNNRPYYFVGIYSIMGVGTIASNQNQFTLDTCFNMDIGVMYVFGYQLHTHSLGTIVSVYNRGIIGLEQIGRGNPQYPQAFYPYRKGAAGLITNGNRVITRCVYDTTSKTNPVYTIGVPGHIGTEMCFVNLLYYSETVPGTNPFKKGTGCGVGDSFPLSSITPVVASLPADQNKLALHALYGNQTGTVSIDATYTMNLDLETF